MEIALIVVVSIFGFLFLILLGVVSYFLLKLIKLRKKELSLLAQSQSIDYLNNHGKDSLGEETGIFSGQNCIDHPELPAKGICSISDLPYCELCLAKEGDIKFARKYLDLILDNTWEEVFILNNEELGADKLNRLYALKKQVWKSDDLPIITQKQFKINIENDRIEAYTMVSCRIEDKDSISSKFDFLKG